MRNIDMKFPNVYIKTASTGGCLPFSVSGKPSGNKSVTSVRKGLLAMQSIYRPEIQTNYFRQQGKVTHGYDKLWCSSHFQDFPRGLAIGGYKEAII